MTFEDQLKEYCECVDVDSSDIAELVNVVSLATCWTRKPCETFLTSERKEVIDLPDCLDCPITFEPYYQPFDPDSFEFSLVKIEGVEETVTPITEFSYSMVDDVFRINPGIPSCECKPCYCGCPPQYKLLVTYDAGYDELPDCILPILCDMLSLIHEKRKCDCGCVVCEDGTTEEEIKYPSGDALTASVQIELAKMLTQTYQNQLGLISLCHGDYQRLWGMVV